MFMNIHSYPIFIFICAIPPIKVVKTRMQLQGELAAKGTYAKPYTSILDAFVTIAKNDGIWALQKGLAPSLCFQFGINSAR